MTINMEELSKKTRCCMLGGLPPVNGVEQRGLCTELLFTEKVVVGLPALPYAVLTAKIYEIPPAFDSKRISGVTVSENYLSALDEFVMSVKNNLVEVRETVPELNKMEQLLSECISLVDQFQADYL